MEPEAIFVRPKNPIWEYVRPLFSYVVLVALGWLILSLLPSAPLWRSLDRPLIERTPITLFRLLHAILAAPLYLYAVFHAPRIVEMFRSVQLREDEPTRLLTEGYYGRIRHPFYAMNILSICALMFTLSSVYTLVLAVLASAVFYYNGYFDERRWLYPRFGEEYAAYAARVPARYFTPVTGTYLALLIVLSITGISL